MKEDVRTSKPKKHANKVIFRVYQTLGVTSRVAVPDYTRVQ